MHLKSLLAATVLCAAPVFATNITLPFNTGTSYQGQLATPGLEDIHYSSMQGAPIYVERNFWEPGLANAQWIGPDCSSGSTYSNGVYTFDYEVKFNSTGFQASSVVLSGLLEADDNIDNILVNGYSYGTWIGMAYNGLHSFTLSNGFIDGLNTIDFEFSNTGGDGGLLIDFTSATGTPDGTNSLPATAAPTPEPASIALLGLGVAGVGLLRRKAKQ